MGKVEKLTDEILNRIKDTTEEIEDAVEDMGEAIEDVANQVDTSMGTVADAIEGVAEEIEDAVKGMKKNVEKAAKKMGDAIKDAVDDIEESAEELPEIMEEITVNMKGEVKQLTKDWNELEKKARKTAEGIEDAWKTSAKGVEAALGSMSEDELEINVKINEKEVVKETNTLVGNVTDIFKEKATENIPVLGSISEYTKGLSGLKANAIGAAIGIATEAVAVADGMDVAMNGFLASTGKGIEETERYQTVLENIYEKGYGDSFEDIANSMAEVSHAMGDVDDSVLQSMTESAYALKEAVGIDFSESIGTAQKLMEDYGLSGEEAMALITVGAQEGLKSSDEFLEKIKQYSEKFEGAKISADDMFKLFEEDADSATEKLKEMKDNQEGTLGSMFEQLKNNIDLLLEPLGDALIPILQVLIEAILPVIKDLLVPIIELFAALLQPIANLVITALTPLIDIFLVLMDGAIKPLIKLIEDFLVPIFTEQIGGLASDIERVLGNIKNHFSLMIDFVKNIFAGNWKAAWQNIKDILKNAIDGFGNIMKMPINSIIDSINSFIIGVNKIKVPEWVPIVGGKSFKIPKIPRLKVGLDYVPSDYFPAFLDEGEAVLTKEENTLFRALGGLEGMIQFANSQYPDVFHLQTEGVPIIIHSHVDLDGKEIGNSVTKYVDNNFLTNEDLRRRGN